MVEECLGSSPARWAGCFPQSLADYETVHRAGQLSYSVGKGYECYKTAKKHIPGSGKIFRRIPKKNAGDSEKQR